VGTFRVVLEIGDEQGARWEHVEALVDTGATYTTAPASLLRRLAVQPRERWPFELANGETVELDIGVTQVRLDGRALPTIVVFGPEGTEAMVGAYTLEGFRLAVDPVRRRLMPVPGLLR
jgi:predicted aspartyl protease